MSHITLTAKDFKSEVLDYKGLVLVDFWAPWCGPCQMLAPVIDELSVMFDGKVKVAKVNIDENGDLASEYGVMSIPDVKIFKDGALVEDVVGLHNKDEYADILNKLLV